MTKNYCTLMNFENWLHIYIYCNILVDFECEKNEITGYEVYVNLIKFFEKITSDRLVLFHLGVRAGMEVKKG